MSVMVEGGKLDKIILGLNSEYDIYAPVLKEKRGRFSDTDLIKYDKISSIEEIVWDKKSTYSPKEIIFPITQRLFYFTGDKQTEVIDNSKKTMIFLRACDINGISRLDDIFLKNGIEKDVYYQRLREKVTFVLMECSSSFDNCFCVSMNTNKTDNYSIAMRKDKDQYLVEIKDEKYNDLFKDKGGKVDFQPQFIEENAIKVTTPDVEEMPQTIYNHEMWDEYNARCTSCGRCNTTCIGCSCFTSTDIAYEENEEVGERRRCWSGCQVDGYSNMAGGHEFRKTKASRMRFKTLHKVYDFKKRFNKNMCVGCGRCDDNCPEYISFSKCINKLTEII